MGILSLSTFSIPHAIYFFQRQLIAVTQNICLPIDWSLLLHFHAWYANSFGFHRWLARDSFFTQYQLRLGFSTFLRTSNAGPGPKKETTINGEPAYASRYCFCLAIFYEERYYSYDSYVHINMQRKNNITTTRLRDNVIYMRFTVRVMLFRFIRDPKISDL